MNKHILCMNVHPIRLPYKMQQPVYTDLQYCVLLITSGLPNHVQYSLKYFKVHYYITFDVFLPRLALTPFGLPIYSTLKPWQGLRPLALASARALPRSYTLVSHTLPPFWLKIHKCAAMKRVKGVFFYPNGILRLQRWLIVQERKFKKNKTNKKQTRTPNILSWMEVFDGASETVWKNLRVPSTFSEFTTKIFPKGFENAKIKQMRYLFYFRAQNKL